MTAASLLRRWQLATLAVGIIATALVALGWAYAPRAFAPQGQATLGYTAAVTHFGAIAARRIVGFEPESPLPAVGVQVGDLILDPPRGVLLAGETIQLRVAHGDVVRSFEISGPRVDYLSSPLKNLLDFLPATLWLVLAITIAVRKRHEIAALLLACALFLGSSALVPNVLPAGRLAATLDVCHQLVGILTFVPLGHFLLTFEVRSRSRSTDWILRALLGFGMAWILWSILMLAPFYYGRIWFGGTGLLRPSVLSAQLAAVVLCGLALANRWRHAGPASRQRLRWLFFAIAVALLGLLINAVMVLLQNKVGYSLTPTKSFLPYAIAQNIAFSCTGLTLAYAILRYRVIDVGFVISRTFVYAVFTGLLLLGFGVAEWLLQHFVHFEGEKSVLLDGAVAVGVFMAVHRARDWIEHAIERVFFRASHDKEAALQHFLEVAAHYSEPDALSAALLAAVDAYSGSHGSGIYEREEDGRFTLGRSTFSDLPREIGPDAEMVLELKTLRKSHHFARLMDASPVLTLPVIRQTELVGFVAVAEKVDRTVYRADEIANLGRAVREVGFDLYALRLEKVEQRGRQLEQQNEALREGLRSVVLIARGVQTLSDTHSAP